MKIKRKNKIRLIGFLIISIILFTSFKPINVLSVDDNYSTYLYNQNINVDNDKAHLLSKQSDGSNSYRNIFQSNFLFPAKLQNNMLSTFQTSSFSHYSFNQFYFDNLNNEYAYQSNDNNENFETSIIPNEFDVINGTNIVNGSLEKQDSSFGKYNSTYSFDDYQETESNYGNYNGTYSFENDIGKFNNSINGINDCNPYDDGLITVVDNIYNHKSVLELKDDVDVGQYPYYTLAMLGTYTSGSIEYWFLTENSARNFNMYLREIGFSNNMRFRFFGSNLQYFNSTSNWNTIDSINNNQWYHLRIEWNNDYKCSVYLNDDLKIDNQYVNINWTNGINNFFIVSYANSIDSFYLDGFGIVGIDDYNENENTNPYGLQTELENDNFSIFYDYNTSIFIKNTDSYRDNIIKINDNHVVNDLILTKTFPNKEKDIIEFSFNISDTQKETRFNLLYNTLHGFQMKIENGLIYYYSIFVWNPSLSMISIESNVWYNVKIEFNTNIYKCNISINGIKIDNNALFNTARVSINSFDIKTNDIDYSIEIDNFDFSWRNGYYENRINNLIPLNDSNYNMYKSEIIDFNTIRVFPNSDINVNWYVNPSGTHYSRLNNPDNNYNTVWNQYVSENTIDHLGFDNIYNIEIEIYSIDLYIRYNNQLGITVYDSFYFALDNEIISDKNYIYYLSSGVRSQTINYNITIPINRINDLEIIWYSGNPNDFHSSLNLVHSYLYLDLYYNLNKIDIISEKNIDYEKENPILFKLHYSICSYSNSNIYIGIFNYDLNNYFQIENTSKFLSFEIKSFLLNESAYFRLDKFKIKIQLNTNFTSNLFIDLMSLNITHIIQNNKGYQEIIAYNHRYDNSDNYKGYSRFELLIYNDSIKYRYSEINFEQDDYIYAWITYNTSNIDVKNIELQSHVRYGLNTLDIEIINFYYIIYINYNDDYTIEFREQSRKELETHKIKSSFNYTSYTRNYLDLTGIIGNYSYNVFKGCRSLYGATTEIFHRNFQIPYFSDDIDVSIPLVLPDDDFSNPDEPKPPTQYYWEYETFKTEYYQDININIGNWTVQFSQMRSTVYKAKYFYQPESVSRDDLGSWKWKIKFTDAFSYTVDFNFLRNAVVSILNLILLFSQWIGYLLIASLSYIFMYLGTTILVFLWNTLVYSLFYALIYIMWYLFLGIYMLLYYIWEGLVWVYENLLIPFFEWFWNECIPWIIDFIIIILAHIITLVIFAITLGQIDYDSTYDTVYLMLRYIADEIIEAIIVFTKHLYYILLFVLYYLLLIGLLYIRYVYVKARGFNNRAEQLHKAFEVFCMPIVWTIDLFRETKELVNPYS